MTTSNQPGWYDDPENANAQRYWDGQNWTPQRQWKPTPSQQPQPAPNLPPPSGPMLPPPPGYGSAEAGQGVGMPTELPPPAWPPPSHHPQGAGAQMASDARAAATGFAAKLSVTAWLLFGGFILAVIATFFPLVTVSAPLMGSVEVSDRGDTLGPVFVLVAVAAGFAYPTLTQSQLTLWRLVGMSVVVGLLGVLMIHWFIDASASDGDVSSSPGFGLLMYGVAVIAMAIGTVRLWLLHRSQTQNRSD